MGFNALRKYGKAHYAEKTDIYNEDAISIISPKIIIKNNG